MGDGSAPLDLRRVSYVQRACSNMHTETCRVELDQATYRNDDMFGENMGRELK